MKFPGWRCVLPLCSAFLTVPLTPGAAAEPEVEAKDLTRVPAAPPAQALDTFQVKPGFKLDLVAAEPLVVDPIALCFDEKGRMFVVEMRDYSERRDEQLGRIRMLEDTDGDGRFDKSTVYAENLAWPTGLICSGGGLFVAATPDIVYLKDTNGDGVADTREVVFTGFGAGVQRLNVQQLVNSFAWGLDNRIHGANGGNGGTITSPKRPQDKPLELRGRDFSFDPRTLELRAESGGGQYGLSFDSEGQKFVCSNSSHIRAVMYEDRYAGLNRFYAMPAPSIDIAVDGPAAEVYRISPEEPWRVIRTKWRVAGLVPGPIEGGGRASGYFTSATGITIYRGDALPPEFRDNAFIADCGSNLVHRKRVLPDGVGYKAERSEDEARVEFLASRDLWFRPVQMANAPDGALYIIDMYREVIEHPWSFPASIKKLLDLNSGNDRGRIYRVVPNEFQPRLRPNLAEADIPGLVKALAHSNGWHRDTAARLIYERQDAAAVQPLRDLVRSATFSLARMHALHALQGLGALNASSVASGLGDQDPVVRQHAVRLLEELPKAEQAQAASVARWWTLAADSSPRVRYQLVFTIGRLNPEEAGALLEKIIASDASDPWMRVAVLNASGDHAAAMAAALLGEAAFPERVGGLAFLSDLMNVVGTRRESAEITSAVNQLARLPAPAQALFLANAVGEGVRRAGGSLAQACDKDALQLLLKAATDLAASSSAADPARIGALRFLSHGEFGAVEPGLRVALAPGNSAGIQRAAIEALAAFNHPEVAPDLLGAWETLTPPLRSLVVEALLRRQERVQALLTAIDTGMLRPSDLTTAQMENLRKRQDPDIRERAVSVLGRAPAGSRSEVIAAFRSALSFVADPARGRTIYTERCATCHRLAGQGYALGPDLESVRANGKEALLVNLLDPNRDVMPKYVNYLVETRDGESYTGLVATETDASVVLRQPNGIEASLLRSNIALMRSLGQSAMPEGLEQGLSAQDMADLIGYVLSAGN